jgi:hypothetical protein
MAEITDAIKRAKLKKQQKSDDLEWWDLHDYIEVAEKLSIITDNTANKARKISGTSSIPAALNVSRKSATGRPRTLPSPLWNT